MKYIFVAISAVILFFPAFWLFSQAVGDDWGAGIAAFFMYLWYPFMALRFFSRNEEIKSDDMAQALAKGELEVSEFTVKSVVEIEEFEDEGMFFLLELSDNQTMCLRGQYLYASVERGTFPSPQIKVFWNRQSGYSYGVEGNGIKLMPKLKMPPLTENHWDSDSLPEDRELINKNIDDVVKLIEENA